jgi:ABC-2 type transport system permease protein
VVFLQTGLLVMFGQLLLGVSYLQAPLAVLLIAAALGLWVSSMGLLIALLARGDDQVNMLAMIAMFIFSALGGAWFPVELAGQVFTAVGNLMPSAWAVKGFQNILIHGLGISSVWQPAAILLAYALGFIVLSRWRFKKMEV